MINIIEFCCINSVAKNISPKIIKLFVSMNYVSLCLNKEFHAVLIKLTCLINLSIVYTKIWKKNYRDSKAPKIMSSRNRLHEGRY